MIRMVGALTGVGDKADKLADRYALRLEENESGRSHQRRQEGPNVAEDGLAVLRLEIAHEQPPSQFATGRNVGGNRLEHLPRMLEQRLR